MCPLLNSVQAWWIQHYFQCPWTWDPPYFTGAWLGLCFLLELTDSWLVCWPWVGSLLSTASELVEGTGSELSLCLCKKKADQSFLHCLSWHDAELQILVSPACKCMAGKVVMQQETDEGSKLPLTLSCHSPWPGTCQSWYILTVDFTPWHERNRNWVRDCLKHLFCIQ